MEKQTTSVAGFDDVLARRRLRHLEQLGLAKRMTPDQWQLSSNLEESLGQFVLYWLTRPEPLSEGERDRAHQLGQKRFDDFIEQVASKLAGADRLSTRLFPEAVIDEREEEKRPKTYQM